MTPKQQHAALKAAFKRSIIVLDALGDNELRFQNMGQVWDRATADAGLAYGYNETKIRIVPTAREIGQAEIVADWLAWLGLNHGGVPRLVAWAHDDPIWRIAERERCSVRTVHNRIDQSVRQILKEFGGVDLELPVIDEKPENAHPPSFLIERPVSTSTAPIDQHGKCWIDGVGFMFKGKRLRTGHDKIDRMRVNAH